MSIGAVKSDISRHEVGRRRIPRGANNIVILNFSNKCYNLLKRCKSGNLRRNEDSLNLDLILG